MLRVGRAADSSRQLPRRLKVLQPRHRQLQPKLRQPPRAEVAAVAQAVDVVAELAGVRAAPRRRPQPTMPRRRRTTMRKSSWRGWWAAAAAG